MMTNEEEELLGPFITVVSVDGGLQCGNKLTVITPTEIHENGKRRNNSGSDAFSVKKEEAQPSCSIKQNPSTCSSHKGKVSAIPTLVGVDRKSANNGISSDGRCTNSGTAYVTVVSFADQEKADDIIAASKATVKSGIPVKSHKNHINTKSIVQLGSSENGNKKIDGMVGPEEREQIITISNKVKGNHVRNSSFVDILSDHEEKIEVDSWLLNEDLEIPSKITEQVVVLKLPGERLGFGLRFEGGVSNPMEKVKHLYIQSCAFDSPSLKATTTWGHLGEGDEIIEIESQPINTMTRMECIQNLKDASVAVRLNVTHLFTSDELSLLRSQREIALKKLKSPNKGSDQSQMKAEREIIRLESKNEFKEATINNNANDSCSSHHVYSATLSSTSSSCSKIPQLRSKQMQHRANGSSTTNNHDNNGNNATSHEEQSGNSIVYEHNENEIGRVLVHDREEDEQREQRRLKPPTGFADELCQPRYQSPISFEGYNKKSTQSNRSFNSQQQQPIEALSYLNAISPTHSHRNSSMSLESYGSDETGSSRSTVISRLSMTSSMTSMSAMMNVPTSDNNNPSSTNCHNNQQHVLLVKRKSSLTSLNSCPERVALTETFFETEKHDENRNYCGSAVLERENGIGTGQSNDAQSEVPLAPPLFFQDERKQEKAHLLLCSYVGESGINSQKRGEIIQNFADSCVVVGNGEPVVGRRGNGVSAVNLPCKELVSGVVASENESKGECNGQTVDDDAEDDVEANWEQKGILDYDEDDESLLILANELGLGLDQEDEDLFNEISEVIENQMDRKAANVDELIHKYEMQHHCSTYKPQDEMLDAKSANNHPFTGRSTSDAGKNGNEAANESSEDKDLIQVSNNGVLFNSNNDRLFRPFSKVVEPINGSIMMKQRGEQIQQMAQQGKENGSDSFEINFKGGENFGQERGFAVQAPAPPPRTKGLEKRAKEVKNLDSGEVEIIKTPRVSRDVYRNPERPASATIVRIEEWKEPEGGKSNSIKLEVRRHNSLTFACSETSGINPERAAASSLLRKGRERDDDKLDADDEKKRIDDSSHKEGNLDSTAAQTTEQGSRTSQHQDEIGLPSESMESSTELLHKFPPPTFSRLPPDGHEFPNSWSDEKLQQGGVVNKVFRSQFSVDSSKSSEPGSPPPLPTSEPPKEDSIDFSAPPLPATVPPPVPPKKMAARRCSFDDRKKLFENGSTDNGNGFTSPAKAEEPSKKSVKDKIAMFSSRSSSEESADTTPPIFPKQISNHVSSSLSKSTANIANSFSKSSENLLAGTPPIGRKGSVDLTPVPATPSVHNGIRPSSAAYGTLTRTISNGTANGSNSLYERSQSMIDVAGGGNNNANYQRSTAPKYSSNTLGRPVSAIMEQRRKCMTKLKGLVIPDGQDISNNTTTPGYARTSSVVDLPTIISKDAVILPQTQQLNHISKPPLYNPSDVRKSLSRTESLDRFASINPVATTPFISNQSAKTESAENFPNILPKYSPAFKRRGLSAYHSSVSASTLPSKTTPINNATYKYKTGATPEPKSLESLTSPRSDSSFEFSSADKTEAINKKNLEKPIEVKVEKEAAKENVKVVNGKSGKLEDSDNDSAVSSSRSSISHGLSPPISPTPGESTAATPDPDKQVMNMEESWRILKPTSIEAINRKNVLQSAKFSNGLKEDGDGLKDTGNGTDDSSLGSNGKNRRSDDEEASYAADAETEDTESSCSELEGSGNRRNMILAGHVNLDHDGRDSKVDTEDDEEEVAEQSAVNMEFTELTESPLQAIYDMEVKMAYINEVCDALNDRGRSELPSRYFSRRDSEATVIERPIESKRKMSIDTMDSSASGDRRARNRSSSGNESDFSSNVSVGSQPNSHKSLSRETSNNGTNDTERWLLLEKKYSRSMTSVNNLGAKPEPQIPQNLTPVTSVPKIVTCTSEVVEKKIEKIIEKTITDGAPKKSNANIPRGRNDFKSISEKWQKIEKSTDSTPIKPIIPEKPVLSPQTSSGPSVTSTPRSISQVTSPSTTTSNSSTSSPIKGLGSKIVELKSVTAKEIPLTPPTPQALVPTSNRERETTAEATKAKLEAMEADRAWAEKRRSEGEPARGASRTAGLTKRSASVSVNDIRKAFEKAEIEVNAYEREEESSPTDVNGKKEGGLALPTAHFRVSSFDSTTSEESSATTPAGMYGSSNSLVSSAPRDPYGSITSLASSTSLISPQELQQLIDEANQSLEEAGTPQHEVSVVILHREFAGGSLGITLAGGADYETKEITVHKVLTASIADRDGRIHRGDRILSINGKSTKGSTHREALYLLKSPRTEVVLVISRGRTASNGFQTIEETSALDRAIEPLLNGNLVIENDDDTCYKWGPLKTATLVKDGAGLGFSLEGGKGSIQGDKPLTVKKIFIGGPAEKSGELKVGDLIVSINGINMSTKSRTEAWNFMKKLNDGEVKISIRSALS